ncbi:hypothetical protein C5942_16375 [Cronobacter sakazakii]|nr:hypothetical protein C5942_16375 [Cronobacter sakazakii]
MLLYRADRRQVRSAYLPYKPSVGWVSTGAPPTDCTGRCAPLTCPTKPSVGWVSASAPTIRLHWQVRSAYLPYKTFRRVGKHRRTHHSPATAGALRLPALQNRP